MENGPGVHSRPGDVPLRAGSRLLGMGSLHVLLLLPARLLPHRTGAMPADGLLQAGVVPARRTATSLLHAVRAGGAAMQGSLHVLLSGALHGDAASSVHGVSYRTTGLPP